MNRYDMEPIVWALKFLTKTLATLVVMILIAAASAVMSGRV